MKKIDQDKYKLVELKEFVKSAGWNEIMVPWLRNKIEENSSISRITTESDAAILDSFKRRKNKIEVYRSVLQYPENEIKKLEKGG